MNRILKITIGLALAYLAYSVYDLYTRNWYDTRSPLERALDWVSSKVMGV